MAVAAVWTACTKNQAIPKEKTPEISGVFPVSAFHAVLVRFATGQLNLRGRTKLDPVLLGLEAHWNKPLLLWSIEACHIRVVESTQELSEEGSE